MSDNKKKLTRHAMAKHALLDRYLRAWLSILGRQSKKVVYVDGFAYTGQYHSGGKDGRGGPGSPLIALKAFADVDPRAQGVLAFVEKERSFFEQLESNVAAWPHKRGPERDNIRLRHGKFEEAADLLLDWLGRVQYPSLFFIDPYGVKGISMEQLRSIMELPKAEVFINVMWVRTALSMKKAEGEDEALAEVLDAFFGSTAWRELSALTGAAFRNRLIELFIERCRAADGGNMKFVRSFAVHDGHTDQQLYWMVFGTNSLKGLEEMKRAMWKQDPTGEYKFGDTTVSGQMLMFTAKSDVGTKLPQYLCARFRGGEAVSIEELGDFVVAETPYLRTHLRQHALNPMLKQSRIEVTRPPGKIRGYPDGTLIRFL